MYRLIKILVVGTLMLGCKSEMSQDPQAELEHLVFIALNDSVSPAEIKLIKSKLNSLNRVEGVLDLSISEALDVGDKRALDYDILLQIWFENAASLKIYSEDEYHIRIKQELKPFLSRPPATFDRKVN